MERKLQENLRMLKFDNVYERHIDAKSDGERITIWREYRGFSRAALGKEIGKNGQYIGIIEAGKRKGTIATISDIAKALKCDIDDICGAGGGT